MNTHVYCHTPPIVAFLTSLFQVLGAGPPTWHWKIQSTKNRDSNERMTLKKWKELRALCHLRGRGERALDLALPGQGDGKFTQGALGLRAFDWWIFKKMDTSWILMVKTRIFRKDLQRPQVFLHVGTGFVLFLPMFNFGSFCSCECRHSQFRFPVKCFETKCLKSLFYIFLIFTTPSSAPLLQGTSSGDESPVLGFALGLPLLLSQLLRAQLLRETAPTVWGALPSWKDNVASFGFVWKGFVFLCLNFLLKYRGSFPTQLQLLAKPPWNSSDSTDGQSSGNSLSRLWPWKASGMRQKGSVAAIQNIPKSSSVLTQPIPPKNASKAFSTTYSKRQIGFLVFFRQPENHGSRQKRALL